MKTFLLEVLKQLISEEENLAELHFILPSKRSGSALKHHLKNDLDYTGFVPEIFSIEEFITKIAGLKLLDNTNSLFQFYEVYKKLTPQKEREDFETFYNWAQTLIYDFNEIDRYLIPSEEILTYLSRIQDLKHWSLQEPHTVLIKNYLKFWEKLPVYYREFTTTLLHQNSAYQGLMYRKAAKHVKTYLDKKKETYIFVGFNALNKAEQVIFQTFLSQGKARIFWDIDQYFLEDSIRDIGYFLKTYRKEWPYYQKNPKCFEGVSRNFKKDKQIEIIGVSSNIGQAKYLPKILQNEKPEETVVVLNDEFLLSPILNSIPASSGEVNVTMGMSLDKTPFAGFIETLFKIQEELENGLYFKNVLTLLNHPALQLGHSASTKKIQQDIISHNLIFLSPRKIIESADLNLRPVLQHCVTNFRGNPLGFVRNLLQLITKLRPQNTGENLLETEYLFHFYQVFQKLSNLLEKYDSVKTISGLHQLYKDLMSTESIDFSGSPFEGLQVMGMLETRSLDFKTVILTSVNEGILPAGKSVNSYLPYDLKREYHLPTFREKDAVYAYHFFRLLQRAKRVYLLYNTEKGGMGNGEKSRFIRQLEFRHLKQHTLQSKLFSPSIHVAQKKLIEIPKTPEILSRIKKHAQSGFSPSALNSYIRNPIDFYKNYVLRIPETNEVEETIAPTTLGTVVHNTLEHFFRPLINKALSKEHLEAMEKKIKEEVTQQFKEIYGSTFREGKNLIIYEVAQRFVHNFLQLEKNMIQKDTLKILHIENGAMKIPLQIEGLDFPVYIKGRVDRVDQLGDQIRVVDYKTGKVENKDLKFSWENLIKDKKHEKSFQVLCYSLLLNNKMKYPAMLGGIISFKNLKSGFMSLQKEGRGKENILIDKKTLDLFQIELRKLILEIFNPEIPFKEKEE